MTDCVVFSISLCFIEVLFIMLTAHNSGLSKFVLTTTAACVCLWLYHVFVGF